MLRIGLLGAGFIAEYYMQALKKIPNQSIEAVFSKDISGLKSAKSFAKKWNISGYTNDLNEIILDKSIDLVIIALPNYLHKEAIISAAKQKKHVLCTKPLGLNAAEADIILKTVEKYGIYNGYLENDVFSPVNSKIKELIDNNHIGKILKFEAKLGHSGPHEKWFYNPKYSGGGVIIDLSCHSIELARFIIGKEYKPLEVFAYGDTLLQKTNVEDNAIILLKFENGTLFICESSWTIKGDLENRKEIYGNHGVIISDDKRSYIEQLSENQNLNTTSINNSIGWNYKMIDELYINGFKDMMEHFISCYNNNIFPNETFKDGYMVNLIIDHAYKSIKSRKWVPFIYE
ncbi:MAG: Gfo/Idh/MocA family protein [Candidatus Humimicrobiaceae bacterium]